MTNKIYGITVTAAFSFNGGASWTWRTFDFAGGNKHAAIVQKAKEIGANAWDFSQADVSEVHVIGRR